MLDRKWHEVYKSVVPLLTGADVILAPRGDWAAFPCPVNYYDNIIEPDGETVFFLHKSRLPAIRKEILATIMANWQCVFANGVFAVFVRSPRKYIDVRYGWQRVRLWVIERYLRSRALKQRKSTIYYVHLPKTGGTSMWSALTNTFRSSVYYGDINTFIANPPLPGEYDLVGLHFSPSVLDGLLTRGDVVAGTLRDPTKRFLSGIVHWRRQSEDPQAHTASQRAMRDMKLNEFVQTDFGSYETRVQLIALGTDYRYAFDSYDDHEMLCRATAFLGRADSIFVPSTDAGDVLEQLSQRLNFRAPQLRQLNTNDTADYARYAQEFREALPVIEEKNAYERQLYDDLCHRHRTRPQRLMRPASTATAHQPPEIISLEPTSAQSRR